jgi:hypothetical protein
MKHFARIVTGTFIGAGSILLTVFSSSSFASMSESDFAAAKLGFADPGNGRAGMSCIVGNTVGLRFNESIDIPMLARVVANTYVGCQHSLGILVNLSVNGAWVNPMVFGPNTDLSYQEIWLLVNDRGEDKLIKAVFYHASQTIDHEASFTAYLGEDVLGTIEDIVNPGSNTGMPIEEYQLFLEGLGLQSSSNPTHRVVYNCIFANNQTTQLEASFHPGEVDEPHTGEVVLDIGGQTHRLSRLAGNVPSYGNENIVFSIRGSEAGLITMIGSNVEQRYNCVSQ